MADKKLPDIPSFEELGISPEELEELERDMDGGDEEDGKPAPPSGKGASGGKGDAAPTPPDMPTRGRGGAVTAPLGGWRGVVSLLFLVGLAWWFQPERSMPSPLAASAPDSVFSSARAMAHLTQIARRAHPPGSPEHQRVRDYLMDELRGLGLEPTLQTATSMITLGVWTRGATVRNIVARIPGSERGGVVLVTAHYDGRGIAKAAGDDGSGVVSILEALRAVRTGPALRNDVIVLFTDAEELGLLGARAFAEEHPWMADVDVVISIEMRGGGGPSIMFETGNESGWVVRQFQESDPYPVANSLAEEIYRRMPNDTDFTPFKEAGKQGLNFAGVGRAHVYHQAYDSPENLSEATLQHHGEHALAALRHFGNANLVSLDAPDPVYFSLPLLGLVVYPSWWAWVLGGVGVLGWIGCLALVRRSGGRWSGVAVGLVAALAAGAGTWFAARFLYAWRVSAHPEAGTLHGSSFHSEGWYVLAIVALAVLVTTLVFALLRRWYTAAELALGAIIVPVVAATVATVAAPLGAMNLQWPVFGGLIGIAAVAGVGLDRRPGLGRWLILLLSAIPVMAFLPALIQLLWLSMNVSLAPVLGAMGVGTVLLLLPLFEIVRAEPNRWWLFATAALAGGAFLGMGAWRSSPAPDRPAPSTLVYLVDHDRGAAWWGTDPTRDDDDPGRLWASSQAGTFADEATWGPEPATTTYATAPAELAEAAVPDARVVSDSTAFGRLRVAFTSSVGAELLRLGIPEGAPRVLAVNGKDLERGEESPRLIDHWGAPEGAVTLDFELSTVRGPFEITVVEHLLRPEELVGAGPFQRPPELAPNITRGSDRAMLRSTAVVDPAGGVVTVGGEASESPEPPEAMEGGAPGEAAPDSLEIVEDTVPVVQPDTTGGPAG